MNRKDFLKATGVGAAAIAINGMPIKALGDTRDKMKKIRGGAHSDRIFVFVVLSGGNDGLNTVIPLDKYTELNNSRSNVVIPANQVLGLSGSTTTGLHPAMTGLQSMFNNGLVNITHDVGYPNFDYSHFRATDIYNTASNANQVLDTGWVGRYIDKIFPGAPNAYPDADFLDPLAVQIGYTLTPMLTGPGGQIGYVLEDLNNFYQIVNGAVDPAPNTPAGHELTFIRYISLQTQAYTQSIQNAANNGINNVTYPANNRLADQLKIVAQLINGGMQTPFYVVEIGGFDTHSDQVDATNTTTGNHADLLRKVSDAINVFYQDIKISGKDDKVAGCTITEFGRRIKSNASTGTDHGSASPMICFGKNVIPGIIGTSSNLPNTATVDDQIPMQYDFRQIYASILEDWFGLSAADTSDVLNGGSYTKLPIFKAAPNGTEVINYHKYELQSISVYPNPVRTHATISFESEGGKTEIILYNDAGQRLKTIYENTIQPGRTAIGFDRENLPAGNYFYTIFVEGKKAHGQISIR